MTKKLIRFLPAILWMCFIFFLSSRQTTSIQGTYQERFIILKSFHLIEYSVLYILFFFAWGVPLKSFISTYLYALTDEFHQSFVPGRTAKFQDTLIDLLGMAIGFALLALFAKTDIYKIIFTGKHPKKSR